MEAFVYILKSLKTNQFYIGSTSKSITQRLAEHNDIAFAKSFTAKGIPYEIFCSFSCDNITHARKIENHIKRMKSKVYINNLIKYPEIIDKLKLRYKS
jgi:putative endonuclease